MMIKELFPLSLILNLSLGSFYLTGEGWKSEIETMRRRKGLIFQHGKVAAAGCYDEGGKGNKLRIEIETQNELAKEVICCSQCEIPFKN